LNNTVNTFTPGFLSTYTTWGPTWELDVKPQISTPGGIIFSTYPQKLGSYAVLSGTSMACPLAAAIIALIYNVRGTKDPVIINSLLSATANPNIFQDGTKAYPYLAPVPQQGGGLVQAYDAAHISTLLSTSSLAFNDTENFNPTLNFTIKNLGYGDVTYSLANVGAATAYSLLPGDIFVQPFVNDLLASYASLEFSSDKITVSGGGEETLTVTLTPPEGLDAGRLPVYSGYITLNGTNGDSLSLPYQGVVGSMRNATVLDTAFVSTTTDPTLNPLSSNTTLTLPPKGSGTNSTAPPANITLPLAVVSLALGSATVHVDVVPATGVNATKPIGEMFNSPLKWNTRGVVSQYWDGRLIDGSYAPEGRYSLRVRALHIFGDENNNADWDQATSQSFGIRYGS
jgi:hypothetical protein